MFWKHYKGGIYEILYKAKDSETLANVIVYQDVRNREKIWVRSEIEWNESLVRFGGKKVIRFEPLTEQNCDHEYFSHINSEDECLWCGHGSRK
jgi:hypothetical protein